MNKIAFYLLCLYASVLSAQKQTILEINGSNQEPVIAPYLEYRILNSEDTSWKILEKDESSLAPMAKFEARFRFKSKKNTSLIFEWPDNKIEYLEVQISDPTGKTILSKTYRDTDGFSSHFFVKNQVLSFENPEINKVYQFHYTLQSHNPSYAICWLRPIQPFFIRFIKEYTWYGWFAGIILSVFVLNCLFYFSHKESTFLWYSLYTLTLGFFHWSYTGIGFQWIWPDFTIWNRYSYMVCSFLMLSCQFIYFYKYTKQLHRIHKNYILAIIAFRFLVLITTIWFPSFSRWHILLDCFTLAFQLWLMCKVLLHKTLHGLLYISSVTVLLISYIIFILAYYQFIITTFFVYNSIAIGGIVELIIGMLALALRFKFLNDEKIQLQQSEISSLKSINDLKEKVLEQTQEKERIQKEVNQELEIKIKERTLELDKKNKSLEDLNQKLHDMSSILDKQNWQLNKELTNDRTKLMWGKNISYTEFNKTFTSDNQIIRFIEAIKWKDTFHCRKCSSSEWIEGSLFLSRKCSTCKYEESVTAHTLFHGVKFPLKQALYISLYTAIHRDNLPVKSLAEEIGLREATVWAFRKKTLEKLSKFKVDKGDVLNNLINDPS